jgi:hypothetical protein
MANSLSSYRPSSIVVAITHPATNTSHIVGGLAKDSMVSIEYPDAAWTEKTLNYGETVRTHSLDNTLRMTLHVDQTSPTNDFLDALAKFDEKDPTGLEGIFTCTFADKSSRTYAYSSESFIKRPMSYEFGSDTSVRDWIVVLTNADQKLGGSGKVDDELVSSLATLGVDIDDAWKIL